MGGREGEKKCKGKTLDTWARGGIMGAGEKRAKT